MALGSGEYKYERVEGWGKIPEYFEFGSLERSGGVVDVACDSKDRVYALCRGNHPVLIFDSDGNFISCWGECHFRWPHGIFIDADDNVYVTDSQAHTVEKFTLSGELLMTLGTRDWGAPLLRRAPFNMPTGLAVGPSGDLFISDGYANYLVHRFSPDGKLLKTWGEPGKGPGQFALPHFIGVDRHGTVYVCDRENDRIQTFTSEGEFITEWVGLHRPADVYMDWEKDIVYVAEIGGPYQPKISIRDLKGNELSSWEGRESEGRGVLEVAHGIGLDSRGNIYEGEIGRVRRIQKFARVS